MKPLRLGATVLVAMLALAPRPARAQTTMTFNANVCGGTSFASAGPTYVESGFQLSFTGDPTTAYAYWCSGNADYPGSPAIFINHPGSTVTLSKVGGGTFSLNSIDMATAYGGGLAGSVLFTGDLFGGGTVTATESWNAAAGLPTFQTDVFSSAWTNLTDVYFSQILPYSQFDNVVVNGNVTPEPATMTLLATGLVGIVGAGLRRRKRP
jgi:hypothetical protein